MKQEINELFDIRNYLVQNNYQKGLIAMLDDYFTNKAISKEEINDIISLPKEEYQHFINNYQLRGAKKWLINQHVTPTMGRIFNHNLSIITKEVNHGMAI